MSYEVDFFCFLTIFMLVCNILPSLVCKYEVHFGLVKGTETTCSWKVVEDVEALGVDKIINY